MTEEPVFFPWVPPGFPGFNRVSTPRISQEEEFQCGPVCLAVILLYYGKEVSLQELKVACGTVDTGVTAPRIAEVARNYGLIARVYLKPADELRRMPMPLILYWDHRHYVVLEGFEQGAAFVNDPLVGIYSTTYEEFEKYYSAVSIKLVPGPGFHLVLPRLATT